MGGGVIAFLLFCTILTQAQSVFNATIVSVSSTENQQLLTKMTAYQAFQVDSDSLYKVVQAQGENVSFQLNIDQYNWRFSLKPYDIYSPGATFSYTDQNGFHMEEAGPANTYKGVLTGDSTSIVRLLVSENAFTGFIRTPTEIYRINPIGFWVTNPANPDIFVVIKESQLTEPPMSEPWCPTSGDEQDGNEIILRGEETLYIDAAVDCNKEMYVNHSSNYNETFDAVRNYIMNVDERYSAELNIRVLLGHVHIWMTPSPFEGPLNANAAWDAFGNYWNANNACINRDVAVLLKGNSGGGWLGYVNDAEGKGAVCVGRATSYALVVESGNTARTIGHELGHWLSAGHTSAGVCSSNCYVMCQSPNCSTSGSNNTSWAFSQTSKNKINSYLTSNDPLFVNYRHDWCLGAPGIAGPDRLCLDQEGTYSYNSFMAGTLFPGGPTHELLWTTGPGLTIVSQDNTAQTVTVKGTGNGMPTWVGVQLTLTPKGISNGWGCSNGAPIVKKQVHAGLPLSAGTPNITSYWVPGYPTGSYHYDIGFGAPESATEYQYTYQVYNVQYPGTYSGVTTNINPLITNLPQGGCFTATVLAGNECGFLTPEQTTNFPVTICFNSPLLKPDGTETVMAEMGGEAIELPLHKLNEGELASTPQVAAVGVNLPTATPIPLQEAVFPNPASNKVTLRLPYEQSRVIVHDIAGRVVATFNLGTGTHEVSSKDWPDGIYFLTVRTEATSNSHRLVIQH